MENKENATNMVENAILSDNVRISINLNRKTKNRAEVIMKHKGMENISLKEMLAQILQKQIDEEFEKIREEL